MTRPKRTTCTFHCACCDLHFSALNAFDAHRRFGGCTARPKDSKKLKFIPREGICNLTKGKIGQEVPAIVWGQEYSTPQEPQRNALAAFATGDEESPYPTL